MSAPRLPASPYMALRDLLAIFGDACRRAPAVGALAAAGLAVGALELAYIRWAVEPRTALAALVAGTADRPFVTRALAPAVVGAVARVMGWPLERAAAAVVYGAAIAWVFAMWYLAGAVMGRRAAFVAAICGAGPVCLLFVSGGYVYDMPTLALMTLALGLMARRRWAAYLALFPIVALCRETSILLVPVYWLLVGGAVSGSHRHKWRYPLAGLGAQAQVFAYVAIRGALAWAYRNNGGAAFEVHPVAHWYFLISYPHANILALAVFGLALAAALTHWADQPALLRAAAVIIPAIFIGYWAVGFPGEIRVCLEAYPPLYLLAFNTVWRRGVLPAAGALAELARRGPASPIVAMLQGGHK